MMIIHAVQKLLNTSRIEAPLYLSQADENQKLYSWYARLASTTFAGKLLVLYVHEPSYLTVLVPGRTLKSTWPEFKVRLESLLTRHHFPASFISHELNAADSFIVSKTNSKSMLAIMNQMLFTIEAFCHRVDRYEDINLQHIEDSFIKSPRTDKTSKWGYSTPLDFWRRQLSF